MTEAANLWILTDGRAGNAAQARGLAEALARQVPLRLTDKTVTLRRWATWLPPEVAYRLGARAGGWPFSGIAPGSDPLSWPWPRAVIGAGRRVAVLVATMRRLHGVTAIQLLDPRIAPSAFDTVVVPEHDGLTGGNVLTTVGALNRLTPDAIEQAATVWQAHPPGDGPRLAVLIGGPSRSADFTETDGRNLMLALETLSQSHALMITTSRRTDPALSSEIRTRLQDRAFVWTGEADGPNPYPALLATATAVLVTEDSVNMASEAATTGLPVHVFPISRIPPKMAQFHENLTSRGASHRFVGEIGAWTYEPLAEADRIAADLVRRGFL